MFLRRLLLVALVLASLALVLQGCAEYEIRRPMADSGKVLIAWEINPSRVPDGHCGVAVQQTRGTDEAPPLYTIAFRRRPDFNSVCLPHELIHAFGGVHQ